VICKAFLVVWEADISFLVCGDRFFGALYWFRRAEVVYISFRCLLEMDLDGRIEGCGWYNPTKIGGRHVGH